MTSPKRAFLDPRTGDRIYVGLDPKNRYYGVTTVIGSATPKQQYLVPWAAKVVAETAVELMQDLWASDNFFDTLDAYTDCEIPYWEIDWELLAEDLKHAWEWERDGAGEIGDEVHEAAERLLTKSGGKASIYEALLEVENVSEASRVRLGHVIPFLASHDVKVVRSEFTTYNDTYGYAGSCDLAAWVDGLPYIIDIKTGSTVGAEVALQLAAYAHGEYCVSDEDDCKHDLPFPDIETRLLHGGVLHLKARTASFREVDVSEEVFDSFVSLLLVKRLWVDGASKEALGERVWKLGR